MSEQGYVFQLPLPYATRGFEDSEANTDAIREFIRRSNGFGTPIFGELSPPDKSQHNGPSMWADRFRTIDENRVCFTVSKARYDQKANCIVAEIKPHGPYAQVIKVLLENQDKHPVTFGIRASLRTTTDLKEIITYDLFDRFREPEELKHKQRRTMYLGR